MKRMEIEYLATTDLIPYENNPRLNDGAVDAVAASIKEFGFQVPIVIDKRNVIVAGHTRLKAAEKLGLSEVPCIRADELTDEQVKAFRLADNKVSEFALWDSEKLNVELSELAEFDIDMSQFGFDLDVNPVEIEEDDFDEESAASAPPRVKRGEIWQLGDHRLMCGDSTSEKDFETLMNGEKADMVFTDPPYCIASDSKNYAAGVSKAMEDLKNAEWDKEFDIKTVFPVLLKELAKDTTVYICTSHFLAADIWTWMKEWSDHYSYCIWSKPNPMPSLSKRHWTWNTELICYATRGRHTFNFPREGHALSTWTINKRNGNSGHPTEKPVEVPAMAVSHSSKKGDIVLDSFGGSGTTLIACEQLGRKCYMMELDPHYCDVIIQRWENLTGKKAVLLDE